jgi:hypothetical protein
LKFEGKAEKHEMQVGRLEIYLVDSLTSLHGHSLVVCRHVQIVGGGVGWGGSFAINEYNFFCLTHGGWHKKSHVHTSIYPCLGT